VRVGGARKNEENEMKKEGKKQEGETRKNNGGKKNRTAAMKKNFYANFREHRTYEQKGERKSPKGEENHVVVEGNWGGKKKWGGI